MPQAIQAFTPLQPLSPWNPQQQASAALASSSSSMQGDSISPVALGFGVAAGGLLTAVAATLAVKHFSTSGDKPKPAQATSLKSVERAYTPQLEPVPTSTKATPASQSIPLSQSVPPPHQPAWQPQSVSSPQPSPSPLPPRTLPPLPPRQVTPDPALVSDGTGSESDIAQTDGNNSNTVEGNEITFDRFMDLPPELRGHIASFLPLGTLRVNHALDDEFRPDMQSLKIKSSQDLHIFINGRRFSHIKSLDLSECHDLSDEDCKKIAKLTNLQHLNISRCRRVTDAGLEHLKTLINLRVLDISGCKAVTDEGLAHFKPLNELEQLGIGGCVLVTDAGLAHLEPLTKLQVIDISGWLNLPIPLDWDRSSTSSRSPRNVAIFPLHF